MFSSKNEKDFESNDLKISPSNRYAKTNIFEMIRKGFILENENLFTKKQTIINLNKDLNETQEESHDFFNKITSDFLDLSFSKFELFRLNYSLLEFSEKLTDLNLSNNSLLYFPVELYHLKKLKFLKLDYNNIRTISNELEKIADLEFLSISNNNLEDLPINIKNLNKLKCLNVGRNSIKTLDKLIQIPNLEVLYLYGNSFTTIPIKMKLLLNKLKELAIEWFKYLEPPLNPIIKKNETKWIFDKLVNYLESKEKTGKIEINLLDFLNDFSDDKFDVFVYDSINRNILHNAAMEDELGILIEIGKNYNELLNEFDNDKQTPLSLALVEEKYRSVDVLINLSPKLNKGGGIFGSLLHLATIKMKIEIIEKILRTSEFEINTLDFEENNCLHIILSIFSKDEIKAKQIANLLLSHGINPNEKNKAGFTPIHLAAKKNQFNAIQFAIDYNNRAKINRFNLNKRGGIGKWTLFHLVSHLGNIPLMENIAQTKINVFKENIKNETALKISYQAISVIKINRKLQNNWIKENIIKSQNWLKIKKTNEISPSIIQNCDNLIEKTMQKKADCFKTFVKQKSELNRFFDEFLALRKKDENVVDYENKIEKTDFEEFNEESDMNISQKICEKSRIIEKNGIFDLEKKAETEINNCIFFNNSNKNENEVYKLLDNSDFKISKFNKELEFLKNRILNENVIISEKIRFLLYLQMIYDKITKKFNFYRSMQLPIQVHLINDFFLNKNDNKSILNNQISQIIIDFFFETFELLLSKIKKQELNFNKNLIFTIIFKFMKENIIDFDNNIKDFLKKTQNNKNFICLKYELLEMARFLNTKNIQKNKSNHKKTQSCTNNISIVINNNYYIKKSNVKTLKNYENFNNSDPEEDPIKKPQIGSFIIKNTRISILKKKL